MDLLTFSGTGRYADTTYELDGKTETSAFVAEALVRLLGTTETIDHVVVGLTPGAAVHENWPKLEQCLRAGGYEVVPVRIPDGRNEDELWGVFAALVDALAERSRVTIDITHALRHIPVVGVALACYVRETKKIDVARILYGAYELRNVQTAVTPVVDITPFLEMIDWVTATRFLSVSGDTQPLAQLLTMKSSGDTVHKHGDALAQLGRYLKSTSVALAVNRPIEATKDAAKVVEHLTGLPESFEPASAPFPVIRDALWNTYEPISQSDLPGVLHLIEWYVERGRYLQAMTLASEYLISYAGDCSGQPYDERDDRKRITDSLNVAVHKCRDTNEEHGQSADVIDFTGVDWADLVKQWDWVCDLRNDMAHCGYRKQATKADTICKKVKKLPERLRGLLNHAAEGDNA